MRSRVAQTAQVGTAKDEGEIYSLVPATLGRSLTVRTAKVAARQQSTSCGESGRTSAEVNLRRRAFRRRAESS